MIIPIVLSFSSCSSKHEHANAQDLIKSQSSEISSTNKVQTKNNTTFKKYITTTTQNTMNLSGSKNTKAKTETISNKEKNVTQSKAIITNKNSAYINSFKTTSIFDFEFKKTRCY